MTLEKRVLETVKNNLETKQAVSLNSRLTEDLQVDSFGKIMLIAGLEDEFAISIDEGDFSEIKQVIDIVEHLKRNYPEIEGV